MLTNGVMGNDFRAASVSEVLMLRFFCENLEFVNNEDLTLFFPLIRNGPRSSSFARPFLKSLC